jgi:hypothetical protein
MKHHLPALLLSLALTPVWAVNKCTGPDGALSFQEAPCASTAKAEALKLDAAPTTPPSAGELRWRSELNRALLRGEPLVGMTESDLQRAMGQPTQINRGNHGGESQNQFVYERRDRTWYVATRDGRVSSIQNAERTEAPLVTTAPAPEAPPCPSPLAFRNLETSASSTTRRESERRALQRQVRDIRQRCGY